MSRPVDARTRKLADLVAALRPQWNIGAVDSVIHAHLPRHGYRRLAHACVDAALDTRFSSPAGIRYILEKTDVSKPTPADRPVCPHCGSIHDPDQRSCKRRNPEVTQRGAAAAKAALANAPKQWSASDGNQ